MLLINWISFKCKNVGCMMMEQNHDVELQTHILKEIVKYHSEDGFVASCCVALIKLLIVHRCNFCVSCNDGQLITLSF
jgi:hypothetical protein